MSVTIPMRAVDRNPDQPRTKFDQATLEELAASIRANGLLQPIVVRKVKVKNEARFQIVAGERRWRAHKLLRAKRIKAEIADVQKELDIEERLHPRGLEAYGLGRDLRAGLGEPVSGEHGYLELAGLL